MSNQLLLHQEDTYDNLKDAYASASPFLKWAGGKSQLIGQYESYFPKDFENYYEPFVGAGAVFFHLVEDEDRKYFLNDYNEELMNVYKVIKNNVKELIEELKDYPHDKEFFYKTRKLDRKEGFDDLGDVKKAARTIYLNRTCFNGLYRVNSKGQFNVPFGKYSNPTICDRENLISVSRVLDKAELTSGDFEDAVKDVKKGDFVYFDPPYQPLSKTSNFTSYTSNGFDEKEQDRLSEVFKRLDKIGVMLMLSNSSAPLIKDLYSDFDIHEIKATRAINSKASGRGKITELLVTNY